LKTFTFTLDEAQTAIVGQGLGELPLKIAAPVLHRLQTQINQQIAAASQNVTQVEAVDADAA
jgi:hypothetical protein